MTDNGRMTLRFLAAPTDVASMGGAVRGGRLLNWIDKAASRLCRSLVGRLPRHRLRRQRPVLPPCPRWRPRRGHRPDRLPGTSSMRLMCTVSSADPCTGEYLR